MTRRSTATTSPSERFRPELLIVDGRNLLFRAADAHRELSADIGEGDEFPTGGIYGFLSVLIRVKQKYQGIIIVAWEGTGNFRYKLFPTYKNKQEPRPQHVVEFSTSLEQQESALIPILSALGVRQFGGDGGEADDVIGTLVEMFSNEDVGIFSNDSDLRQLVREKRQMYTGCCKCICPSYGKDVLFGPDEVVAKYGIVPERIPDLKALSGDSSDGIPGIPGVGEKTASQMLQLYGDLEGVMASAEGRAPKGQVDSRKWTLSPRFQKLVVDHAEKLPVYLQLTTIKRDIKLTAWPAEPDPMAARRLMAQFKFKSLLEAGPFTDLKRLGV